MCAARALTAWPPRGKRGHVLFAWPRAVARDIRDDITHRGKRRPAQRSQGGDLLLFLFTHLQRGVSFIYLFAGYLKNRSDRHRAADGAEQLVS